MSEVTYHDEGEHQLATSLGMKEVLDALAFTITAHAVPHSGVDTGRLIASMGHKTEKDGDSLVARLGSGVADGVEPVWYSSYHWADREPPGGPPTDRREIRRHIPHPTKPAPTRPYAKAMQELGIVYTVNPGGYES